MQRPKFEMVTSCDLSCLNFIDMMYLKSRGWRVECATLIRGIIPIEMMRTDARTIIVNKEVKTNV